MTQMTSIENRPAAHTALASSTEIASRSGLAGEGNPPRWILAHPKRGSKTDPTCVCTRRTACATDVASIVSSGPWQTALIIASTPGANQCGYLLSCHRAVWFNKEAKRSSWLIAALCTIDVADPLSSSEINSATPQFAYHSPHTDEERRFPALRRHTMTRLSARSMALVVLRLWRNVPLLRKDKPNSPARVASQIVWLFRKNFNGRGRC
ncbi:uncharacterized protein CC84DRAFT_476208 [Paraphaeosphaeria sporulosa]|uniref:Uncharacterized protein n=1 Tax=Paraphaeosphaeria sporulosa TaxID=1460663 RepID=A0A177CRW6_9PLEO|nr:uncharacterized protein CC84DRAFT_476208 [Paraphaeosphaeria sporulosa]OAG10274.1 hypothetical protein CC84DRAFT_476208 [Paraphaeosphaeria sporulosa]